MDKKAWHYIDLEEFEFQIRQEEREKEYNIRCRQRRINKLKNDKRRKAFIKSIPYRVLGLLLIILSIKLISYDSDGTFALLTIPIGLLTLFCPLSAVSDI